MCPRKFGDAYPKMSINLVSIEVLVDLVQNPTNYLIFVLKEEEIQVRPPVCRTPSIYSHFARIVVQPLQYHNVYVYPLLFSPSSSLLFLIFINKSYFWYLISLYIHITTLIESKLNGFQMND